VIGATATTRKIIRAMVTLMGMKKKEEEMVVVAAVPHKEDVGMDVVVILHHRGRAMTYCAKSARKRAIVPLHVGGTTRTTTITTTPQRE
jgi:hypothetical protein